MTKAWLKRDGKLHTGLSLLFLAAAVTALCLLLTKITVYSDDYHFGVFFRDGWSGFFAKTADHYLHSNGRLLVHFLLEVTLLGDTKAFLVLCPAVIMATAALLPMILGKRDTPAERFAELGVTIFLLIALPASLLRESFLWMSGAFNYMVPMVFVFAAAAFQRRALDTGKTGFAGVLLAFLAGATTEQFGLFACIVLWGIAIMHSVRTPGPKGKAFLLPVAVILGYLTVLAAPGTWVRVGTDSGGLLSILDPSVLAARVGGILDNLTGTGGSLPMLALFCVVSASLAAVDKEYPRPLLCGYPLAIIVYLLAQFNTAAAGCVFMVYLFAVAVLLVRHQQHTAMGCLLLGAIGSQLIIVLSGVYGYRTTLPFTYMLILAMASFGVEALRRWTWLWYLPVCAAVIVIACRWYLPTYQGYSAARVTIDQNLAAIAAGKRTGEIHLSMDADQVYGYTSFYPNSYFYTSFLDYYRVDTKTTKVYVESAYYPAVYVNGKEAALPAVSDDQGNVLFPIATVAELSGGSCVDKSTRIHLHLGDADYWLKSNAKGYALYGDAACRQRLAGPESLISSLCGSVYLRGDVFKELFGITYRYDEARQRYELTAPSGQ